ncbi:protein phosphatase [Kitasatospora sp. NPDC048540]|uniref:protein-tyrosine phosphatase family protein n=1 Tax=unclassified Kitasatospora TaxID=2633591 RepID=UPI00053A6EAB|nr:protein phosphatase [Kitasatospora sp. MBT63]
MRTRQRDRDIQPPRAPWSEIRPGLWIGGHYWFDPAGEMRPVVVEDEFDLVLSLFARPGHGPAPGVEHHLGEMPDAPLGSRELARVRELAALAADAVRGGRTTLVRCHSGYNRSGLVAAETLRLLGHGIPEAVGLVRRGRSPWALNNEVFVQYLEVGLDIAALLTGLEEPV